MRVIWLNPVAWIGAVTVVVPIVIHLLTRQQTRRLPFPTLRFLRPTHLVALRRSVLRDWLLLTVRLLALATAIAALAAPVFVSRPREDEWRSRIVRAMIVSPNPNDVNEQQEAAIERERRDSFASAVFRPRVRLADGIRDAALWIETQPPALREIVVVGDLKTGMLTVADLSSVPAGIGLRFLPFPESAKRREVELSVQQGDERLRVDTTLLEEGTRAAYSRDGSAARPMSVRAAPADQTFAEASLNAVLGRGLVIGSDDRRVLVAFDGADISDLQIAAPATIAWMRRALARLPGMSGGQANDTLIVRAHLRARGVEPVRIIDRVAHAVFDEDRSSMEPTAISALKLAEWSRPSVADDATGVRAVEPRDEGDRRWLWGAALLLLGFEMLIRRRERPVQGVAAHVQGERVA